MLKCRVADIFSAPSGLVLRFPKDVIFMDENFICWFRLEDGTNCSLRTVEFCGLDTQTDEVSKASIFAWYNVFVQVGEESSFIDLWLDAEQGQQVEDEGVRRGSLVQVEHLVPVNVGEEDDVVVRFVSGGVVKRLQGEVARGLATTIDERKSESQLNMTSVQAVINMVDMDGTFEYESQQGSSAHEVANSVQENPPSSRLAPVLCIPQVGGRKEDRTVDISLSPWDPSQTNQKKVSQQGKNNDEMVSLSTWNSADQSSTNKTNATPDPSNANGGVGVLGEEVACDRLVAEKQIIEEDIVEGALNSFPGPAVEEDFGDAGSSQGSASLLDSQESQVSAL